MRRREASVTPPTESGNKPGDDVGLRELGLAAVEHERLPAVELVVEQRREARVPTLGQLRRDARRALFARVVIDVEMFGGENAEVEVDVLDLVAAEILCAGRRCAEQHHRLTDTSERTDHT